jgi:hypothetical protein
MACADRSLHSAGLSEKLALTAFGKSLTVFTIVPDFMSIYVRPKMAKI